MVAGVSGVRSVGTGDTLRRAGVMSAYVFRHAIVLDRVSIALSIACEHCVCGALAVGVDHVPPPRVLRLLQVYVCVIS